MTRVTTGEIFIALRNGQTRHKIKKPTRFGLADGTLKIVPERWSLHPFQCALFPDPDVPHDQDTEKNPHFQQPEQAQQLELHGPREQEDRLDVEHYEQDGDNVKPHRVAAARIVKRRNAALVRHQLGLAGLARADQVKDGQRSRSHRESNKGEGKYWYVILRHESALTSHDERDHIVVNGPI